MELKKVKRIATSLSWNSKITKRHYITIKNTKFYFIIEGQDKDGNKAFEQLMPIYRNRDGSYYLYVKLRFRYEVKLVLNKIMTPDLRAYLEQIAIPKDPEPLKKS